MEESRLKQQFKEQPNRGFTILELMTALLISSFMLVTMTKVFERSYQQYHQQRDNSEMVQRIVLATNLIQNTIENAGSLNHDHWNETVNRPMVQIVSPNQFTDSTKVVPNHESDILCILTGIRERRVHRNNRQIIEKRCLFASDSPSGPGLYLNYLGKSENIIPGITNLKVQPIPNTDQQIFLIRFDIALRQGSKDILPWYLFAIAINQEAIKGAVY